MGELGLKARSLSVPERGARISILLAGEETAGRYGLVETVEEQGGFAPRHCHHREDETLYVIEGSLSVWVADGWVQVPAGTTLFLRRGVEHALVAKTGKVRVLSLFAPAGFEGFYREMAHTGPLEIERLITMAARYGCEITGPTPDGSSLTADEHRTCLSGFRPTQR